MATSLDSSSFHIGVSPSSSLSSIAVSLLFLSDSFCLIEFMLFMHVNLNYCLLNFVGSIFSIEFRCEWWSTNPKISQALIRSNIPKSMFWWKWTTTWGSGFWWRATYLPSTLAPLYDVNKREKNINLKRSKNKHIKNGWINHLFNSHLHVLSHQYFETTLVALVPHMLGMEEIM